MTLFDTLSLSQRCLLVSIIIFIYELAFLTWARHKTKTIISKDPIINQLKNYLETSSPFHTFLYTVIYVGLLLLAKFFTGVFIGIFMIQGLSIGCNTWFYYKLKSLPSS